MRGNPPTRLLLIPVLLAAAACQAEPSFHSGPDLVQEVEGVLQRVDIDDPDSPWVGEERVQLVDRHGEVLCDGDVELDGELTAPCDGCELTLDVRRQILHDIAEDCEEIGQVQVTPTERYVSFVPTETRGRFLGQGIVLHADTPDGRWELLATGASDGNRILYRRSQRVNGDWTIEAPRTDTRPLPPPRDEWERYDQ